MAWVWLVLLVLSNLCWLLVLAGCGHRLRETAQQHRALQQQLADLRSQLAIAGQSVHALYIALACSVGQRGEGH